ncbi:MAG: MFS transporter [Bacilli bacterium]
MNKKYFILLFIDALFALILIENIKSLYLNDVGLSIASISIATILYQISKIIFEIPTGYIGDKYGNKLSVIIGLLISIASFVLLLKPNLYIVIISSILYGIAKTFISGSYDSLIYTNIKHLSDSKVKLFNSINRFVWYIAFGMGISLSYYLYKLFGASVVIIATIVMHLVAISLLSTINDDHSNQDELTLKGSFKYLIQNKKVTSYFMSFNLFCFSDIPFDVFALVILTKGNINTSTIALGLSLSTTLSVFGSFISVRIKEKYHRLVIYGAPVISLVFLFIAIYTNNNYILVVVLILKGIILALSGPIRYLEVNKLIDNSHRSLAWSLNSLIQALLSSTSLALFALLVSNYSYAISLYILIVLSMVLSALNYLYIKKEL